MAAIMLGMHVGAVSIQAKDFPPIWHLRGGVIASFDHMARLNRDKAEKAAVAGLAGEQAELLWCKQRPWRRVKGPRHVRFSGDRAYVENMLQPVIEDSEDKRRTIKHLKEVARTLLAKATGFMLKGGRKTCGTQGAKREGSQKFGRAEKIK